MSLVKFQDAKDLRTECDTAIASADVKLLGTAMESAYDQVMKRDELIKDQGELIKKNQQDFSAQSTHLVTVMSELAEAKKATAEAVKQRDDALKNAQPAAADPVADRTPEALFNRIMCHHRLPAEEWPSLPDGIVEQMFKTCKSAGTIQDDEIPAVYIYASKKFAKVSAQEQAQMIEQEKREERTYPFLPKFRAVDNILEALGNPSREDCIAALYSLVDSKQLSLHSFPFICIALADDKYKYKLLMSYMTQQPETALAHYNMTVFKAQEKYDKSMLYSYGKTVLELSLPLSGLELMNLKKTSLTVHQQNQAGVASNQMNLHVLNGARSETPTIEGSGIGSAQRAEMNPKQASIVQHYFSKSPGVQVGNHVIFGGANMPIVTIPIVNRSGQASADLAVDGTMIYTETRKLEEKIHHLNTAAYNKIAELEAIVKSVSRQRQKIPRLPQDVYHILLSGGKLDKHHCDVICRVLTALRKNLKAERRKVEEACTQAAPVTGGLFPSDEEETFRCNTKSQ